MRLFDILRLCDPAFSPEQAKIHLATWNGVDEPIDVYVAGEFNEWQRWQNKRNFRRRLVVSLISMPDQRDRWLFAGVHESHECRFDEEARHFYYELDELSAYSELNGRAIAQFSRPGRSAYLLAEKWQDRILLSEIRPDRLTIGTFPGYRAVDISRKELGHIAKHAPDSWRSALANVAGVYLISDTASGKLYVGSATGEGGIWRRWCEYAETGHGGNVELRKLLTAKGLERQGSFRFSVLEIADTHASSDDVLEREAHWKRVLLTREHGLNAN